MTALTAAGLGLDHGSVRLAQTSDDWLIAGARLRDGVAGLLGGLAVGVEQIGSSSVVGLAAKPIIDLAVGLGADHDLRSVSARLAAAGWLYRGDAGDDGGHVFVLEARPGHRVAHLHAVDHGGLQWRNYLRFRDVLCSSPAARDVYQAVKLRLADEHPDDRTSYTAGKSTVVRSLLSGAPIEVSRRRAPGPAPAAVRRQAGPMSGTYQWVDRYHDPQDALHWQERVDAWPAVVAYKRRTHELLAGADRVLDVGCGPGVDLLTAGSVGLDRSLVMLRHARQRSSRPVIAADAAALPFTDGSFAGVRADRVVQHTEDPAVVIAELARVLAPDGTLVVADPDQGTLTIEVPTASQSLVDLVTQRRRTVQYRSGSTARRLPAMLAAAGLVDVGVEAFALVLTDPDDAFGLATWVDGAVDAGAPGFEERHREEWAEAIEQARIGPGFVYVVTYLVVAGRKPA